MTDGEWLVVMFVGAQDSIHISLYVGNKSNYRQLRIGNFTYSSGNMIWNRQYDCQKQKYTQQHFICERVKSINAALCLICLLLKLNWNVFPTWFFISRFIDSTAVFHICINYFISTITTRNIVKISLHRSWNSLFEWLLKRENSNWTLHTVVKCGKLNSRIWLTIS